MKEELAAKGYTFISESDCEILLPLYREYGVEMFKTLDAEFALILYDGAQDRLIAARDPIGIRPLYYGVQADGGMAFASEPKNLLGLCEEIRPFPPGHYWVNGEAAGCRCAHRVSALRRTGFLPGVCHCGQDSGETHSDFRHRYGCGCH